MSMLLNCIQTLLGQRDLSATGEYTHVSIEQLKQVHNATHLGKGGSLQFIII
jgi:site-specific recombinase XerD